MVESPGSVINILGNCYSPMALFLPASVNAGHFVGKQLRRINSRETVVVTANSTASLLLLPACIYEWGQECYFLFDVGI